MRRREFVALGVSGLMVAPAWAAGSEVAVEILLDGQTYRYEGAAGTDLGAYSDPQGQFVQDCIRVDHPQLPLSIFIRPDRGTDRLEVVFELGRCWGAKPQNLPQYRARIMRGPTAVASIDVPAHYWFSRWRWQSAPRPVRAKPSQLMDQWLVPRLSGRLQAGQPPGPERYQPMGLAGLSSYMGTTGERSEIGLLTDAQAMYLCTEKDVALNTLLAQAEAAGTYPWNIRDEKTGAPVDTFAYPKATIYGPEQAAPYFPTIKTPVFADQAHQPALAYLPFLLTGDPYHLEQLQLMATFNTLTRPWSYRYETSQVRGEAWSLRTWAQAAKITPAAVPKWLLPQAHWQRLLKSYLDWYLRAYVSNREPPRAFFRTTEPSYGDNRDGLLAGTYVSPWQDDFLAAALGWMVLMGYSEWRPVFEWKLGSTIARTNGQSGWPRSECVPYRMVMRANSGVPWVSSWKEAWDLTAAALKLAPPDPDRLDLQLVSSFGYTRGVLVLAKHLDVAAAAPCLDWADNEVPRAIAARPFPYKWALV